MRKNAVLILVIIVCFISLTGCANYTYESKEIEATVTSCEKGTLIPAPEYVSLANMYLIKKNTAMYAVYMNLAHTNGTYNYNITITVDEKAHVVVRQAPCDVGQVIVVTAEYTYANGVLVSTTYD